MHGDRDRDREARRHDWHGGWGHPRGAPPRWWPQGEHWPPHGPPWGRGPRRFRRRLLFVALGVLVLWLLLVVVTAMFANRGVGPGGYERDDDRGPGGLLFVVGGVAVVGTIATTLAYRRLGKPVGELLGAAEQVAEGDYDVDVHPEGPRELRLLTASFNEMASRLAESEEQRRRFLADVTHELRTPLAVLQGGIEAQLDGIHPRDDAHLASLLEETQRLGHLVDDLHTLALAEAGKLTLHREPVYLATLFDDAVTAHTPLAERTSVTIERVVDPELPSVEVDPSRIRQVIDNLLSNAVRHTPTGGTVTLRAEPDSASEAVRVTVDDSGPGFAESELGHVFDRFRRSADSGGSGLGLAIVRDLVQAHGGRVEAANRPGGGATVRFTLPISP